VLEALEQLPVRIDTPLPVPGQVGQLPEPRAAGPAYRTPYALRHTFVSECIAAGIATFEIARMTGTSVLQIEPTYGHLLPPRLSGRRALDCLRGALKRLVWAAK